METNQVFIKKQADNIFGILAIIGLQLLAVFVIAYSFAYYWASGGGINIFHLLLGSLVGFIGFPILGIIGLITFFKKYNRHAKNRPILYILLTTSFLMTLFPVPLKFAKETLSPFLSSAAEYHVTRNRQARDESYLEYQDKTYHDLVEIFEKPQKVVDGQFKYLVLENGEVVELLDADKFITQQDIDDATQFIKQNLIGKEVKISLPEYKIFQYTYSGAKSGPYQDLSGRKYGDIEALVYLDRELINVRFAQSPNQRYLNSNYLLD